ncbi:penicillin acylase family protein [Actinocrispum sp. NPDC049592]|uniref:penicillin acylase family protein n=1 Tax=Actinocrispum sp. NPDC049592 TaxID=3154835 RepID=UPI00343046E8
MPILRRLTTLAAAVGVALSAIATASAAQPDTWGLSAVVRYTEGGVPHIKANTLAGAGFGYGYAVAKDNICALADLYVTLSAQRSRYFGPSSPGNPATGDASTSLTSDLYYQQVNDSGVVERDFRRPAPLGPQPEARELIRGYVAGYNKFVATGKITDPACRGAAWIRPITELDVFRHMHSLTMVGGQGGVIDDIVTSKPPTPGAQVAAIPADAADRVTGKLKAKGDLGSNAIAFGTDGSANGRGLLLGNPHYPWQGALRFWQVQLTVPGQLDVTGATVLGVPEVQIGYNRDVAWSHTVATPIGFSLFQLQLVPGSPTTYLVDGRPEQMTSRKVSVQARNADGSLSTVERTLWFSRYGPVLGSGFDLLSWTDTTAYAMKDANVDNSRSFNTWYGLGTARDTRDVVKTLSSTLGSPWVNTIAADRSGNALYSDIQVVPHITDELAKRCNTPLGQQIFQQSGVAVLDGSKTSCGWGSDPDAVQPGLFGPSKLPNQVRKDYVGNANDSAWLTNLRAPITGYPRIVGTIGTERSPRTRELLTEIDGKRFSRQSLQDMLFSDRSFTARLVLDDVLKICADVPDACSVLARWDRTFTVSSKGSLLFDRFMTRARPVWKIPFNPADPVRTPNTLDTNDPALHKAFTDTVAELRAAGIPLDAPLGDNQFVVRNGTKIPVHGAANRNGVLNVLTPVWQNGYTEVVHGSSYIQAVSYDGTPCPDAQTLLTYSQSSDPTSPHFADQTKLFSQSKWQRGRFCERDILSSPQLQVVHLHG